MEELHFIYMQQRIRRFALANLIFLALMTALIAFSTQTYFGLAITCSLAFCLIFFFIPDTMKQYKIERMVYDAIKAKKPIKIIEW